MSNEFEPLIAEDKQNVFNVWEFKDHDENQHEVIENQEEPVDKIELLRQEAKEQGYAEGMMQAKTDIDGLKKELTQWVELLKKPIQIFDDQLTQELIKTMFWLCKECIGLELTINPQQLESLLDSLKPELPSFKDVKHFAMHPLDAAWIKENVDAKKIPGLHDFLVEDATLSRGDFYLGGEHSELDGRLLARFSTVFAKYMKGNEELPPIQVED